MNNDSKNELYLLAALGMKEKGRHLSTQRERKSENEQRERESGIYIKESI